MRPFRDYVSLHATDRDHIETNAEHEADRVDDLDQLSGSRAQ
jgi:hypothetical protein